LPEEDLQAAMYETAIERARAEGLERYEISNLARPGLRSRHNSLHWFGQPYLGLGAGAHGFVPSPPATRWWNLKSPRRWERSVRSGRLPEAGREELTEAEQLAEAVLLGLRTVEGLPRPRFRERFGVDPGDLTDAPEWSSVFEGRVEVDEEAVRLTDRGFLVADALAGTVLCRLDPPQSAG
jgi:oxygen-independent coproporphyrinogen-3 oxidase